MGVTAGAGVLDCGRDAGLRGDGTIGALSKSLGRTRGVGECDGTTVSAILLGADEEVRWTLNHPLTCKLETFDA